MISKELIDKINKQNKEFRLRSFRRVLENENISTISDKSRKYLLKVAMDNPDKFYEMAITPELCSVSAAMVVTLVKDLILERPIKRIAIDLYHGTAFSLED